jgi:glyoxylase-like metal-dependent hydrolase (beta-lactamase superfamily II)
LTKPDGQLPAGVVVLERGWLSSNNVLCVGDGPTMLIDSGYATHAEQTLLLVESLLAGRALDQLLNTHLHSDHCGGNAALQERFPGLVTRIPPGEARAVAQWDPSALSFHATGQQCPRFRFDALLLPGSTVQGGTTQWEIHAAPGHDPHSVMLFESASRTLISADALWENGFGVVFPELIGEPSFDRVAATLDLIERLRPAHVIPGHGAIFSNVMAALTTARRRLESLMRDPLKHARHAAKVLMKFKLLELQSVSREEWSRWVAQTRYFEMIRRRFFPELTQEAWTFDLLEDLIGAGAACTTEHLVCNA